MFSIFHFGYELIKSPLLKPFCGINESVFQHLKMAFWGYALLSIGEYFLLKKRNKEKNQKFLVFADFLHSDDTLDNITDLVFATRHLWEAQILNG